MAAVVAEAVLPPPEVSPGRRALRRLVRRRGAMVGLAVVVAFILIALLAPYLSPHDPLATSWSAIRKPPGAAYLFGTDELGRDVFSRVIWGARASLLAGLVSVCISLALGVPIGLAAGYLGGWIDALISRITDAMLACPFLILAIALAPFLGPSLTNAMIAIGISATPVFIRLTRAQVLAVKVEDYVEAARALGNPHLRIAWRHVLPNVVAPLMTPIFGVALGLARGDLRLLRTALIAEFGGALVGVVLCFGIGLLPFAVETTPSLLAQTRPTLIDLMVELREKRSLEKFKQMADDPSLNEAVRQRAAWGVKNLS